MRPPDRFFSTMEKRGLRLRALLVFAPMNILPFVRPLVSGLPVIALILFAASALAEDQFTGTWRITDAQTLTGRSYGGSVRIASIGGVYEL
jgi:hypothetical protein